MVVSSLEIANQQVSLTLSPTLGGSVTSFRFRDGEDIMRPYSSGSGDPRDTACFVMVPLANRVDRGRFEWLRNEYQLSPNMSPNPHYIHGEGWHSDQWQVVSKEQERIAIALEYRPTSPDCWPFAFRAEVSYQLQGAGLLGKLRLVNNAPHPVPAGMGFHPYFPRHSSSTVLAQVGRVMLVNYEDMMPSDIVTEDPLIDRLQKGTLLESFMDNTFSLWEGDCIIEQPGQRITMRASQLFSHLHCYSPKEDYFCVEPVSQAPNVINYQHSFSDERIISLAPQQSIEGSFSLQCQRGN